MSPDALDFRRIGQLAERILAALQALCNNDPREPRHERNTVFPERYSLRPTVDALPGDGRPDPSRQQVECFLHPADGGETARYGKFRRRFGLRPHRAGIKIERAMSLTETSRNSAA
jgi:hypothetical protein